MNRHLLEQYLASDLSSTTKFLPHALHIFLFILSRIIRHLFLLCFKLPYCFSHTEEIYTSPGISMLVIPISLLACKKHLDIIAFTSSALCSGHSTTTSSCTKITKASSLFSSLSISIIARLQAEADVP